jgi:hypothetical protein
MVSIREFLIYVLSLHTRDTILQSDTHFAILFLTVLNVQNTPLALDSHVSRAFTFQTFCYHNQLIRNVGNATIDIVDLVV